MTADITTKTYKKLIIEVNTSVFNFCVFNTLNNQVIQCKSYPLETNVVIDEAIWKIFIQNVILNESYDDVVVLHQTNINTFVPSALFDPNFLGSYLQYNNKVFETDDFAFDYIDTYDLNNIFVPFTQINNYLLEHFNTFDYKNSHSVFVKKMLDLSKNNDEKQVYINFKENNFEIVVIKNKQLLLFNSFNYKTIEDFIYYLLFTFEQLQLNPELVPLQFIGNITENSDYFKIAFKYIRNCNLLDVNALANNFNISTTETLQHYLLLHS